MLKVASRPRRTAADLQTRPPRHCIRPQRSFARLIMTAAAGTAFATASLIVPRPSSAHPAPVAANLALLGSTGSGDAAFTAPTDAALGGIQRLGAPLENPVELRITVAIGLLRSEASTSSQRVARLHRGTVLTVIAQQGQWYHVHTPAGDEGWVAAEIVDVVATHAEAAQPATTTASAVDAGSAIGRSIAARAMAYVGYPYRYGGAGPSSFDCSGLTRYVYGQFGMSLPHQARAQSFMGGTRIGRMSALQPGDLVFFANTAGWGISHAAIYVGNGLMVTANTPRTGVQLSRITDSYWRAHWAWGLRLRS